MSSDLAISVNNISKRYMIYDSPQDRLKQTLWCGRKRFYHEFWALKNVSFDVKKGETVAIIGSNGSGKSTLLQIIAETLTPTSGEIMVCGRVAALLELGSGFNPEFTGRENVFINGAILGFNRADMEELYDEIVAFADIGEYINMPVKTYSSGMTVRLAFAVQAIVPKEVLIVDEALSVGDELFQRKCFAKLEEFKSYGGTILFVSHDGGAVVQLCNRAMLLDQGEKIMIGPSKQVVNLYQKFIYAPSDKKAQLRQELKEISNDFNKNREAKEIQCNDCSLTPINSNQQKKSDLVKSYFDPNLITKETIHYESRGARISNGEILTIDGKNVNLLVPGKRYIWRYFVEFSEMFTNVRFGMLIKTINGLELGGAVSARVGYGIPEVKAGSIVRVEYEFKANLAPGTYFFNAGVLALVNGEEVYLDRCVELGVFKIIHDNESLMTSIVDFEIIPQTFIVNNKGDMEEKNNIAI
jgi:lipopolysaccharide transport system ATP-binding protein